MTTAHEPRNVLVTGGAGFIGCNLVRHLLASDPGVRVVSLDALTYAGSAANLDGLPDPGRHELVRGDIGDHALVDRLLRERAIDTVVHLAAESHVDRSIAGPEAFVRTNVLGTQVLLEACRRRWLVEEGLAPAAAAAASRRFHHVSTDEVYGSLGPGDPAFTEATPYAPNSPYAASKAGADHLVRAYHRTYGLPVTVTNCSNNFGPHQHPEKLIPTIVAIALRGERIPIYGSGGNVRDWLHVDDHCRAIDLVLRRGRVGERYNVGGGNEVRNLDLAWALCRLLNERRPAAAPHERLIALVPDRPGHDWRYAVDGRKIGRELGWSPAAAFGDALARTLDWYIARHHPDDVAAPVAPPAPAAPRGGGSPP